MRVQRRALLMAVAMGGTALLAERVRPRRFLADEQARLPLARLVPARFGDWTLDPSVAPLLPDPQQQQVIADTYDEVLAQSFRNGARQLVMLSLAYGRNQHKGMLVHRPEICYPAQGFRLERDVYDATIALDSGPLPLKRLVASQGRRHEPISYWVVVGDTLTAFGYPHRWVALRYGLQGLIPDGVLVRVSSLSADNAEGFALQAAFIRDWARALSPEARLRLLGRGQA
ncbi:EpsI family protein [Mitsuaria sp. WAJ17]|uniref:exosortase-associated protein EpsI, B-type n=1 Tax=Mitsuaria sp. WAJ17 TaxID=2761452 RepID=UPI0016008DF0|nr:exosortase-associated protein EpsI, B-type [Mitsuaria sp. WAJ17]MBB2484302.1 EpsI family protein [Mitsuaria sp. WAJ17]